MQSSEGSSSESTACRRCRQACRLPLHLRAQHKHQPLPTPIPLRNPHQHPKPPHPLLHQRPVMLHLHQGQGCLGAAPQARAPGCCGVKMLSWRKRGSDVSGTKSCHDGMGVNIPRSFRYCTKMPRAAQREEAQQSRHHLFGHLQRNVDHLCQDALIDGPKLLTSKVMTLLCQQSCILYCHVSHHSTKVF